MSPSLGIETPLRVGSFDVTSVAGIPCGYARKGTTILARYNVLVPTEVVGAAFPSPPLRLQTRLLACSATGTTP